jgi:hypothetical protein
MRLAVAFSSPLSNFRSRAASIRVAGSARNSCSTELSRAAASDNPGMQASNSSGESAGDSSAVRNAAMCSRASRMPSAIGLSFKGVVDHFRGCRVSINVIGTVGISSGDLFDTRLPLRRVRCQRAQTADQLRQMHVVIRVRHSRCPCRSRILARLRSFLRLGRPIDSEGREIRFVYLHTTFGEEFPSQLQYRPCGSEF